MTVATETGYSWTLGKHARLLHAGNKLTPMTITASDEAVAGNAQLVDNGLTRDRWAPFANALLDPADFGSDEWTATNLTVSSDGQTVTETTDNGEHDLSQTWDFTAEKWVVSFLVRAQTVPEVQVRANDGTDTFSAFFDLRDKSVGTEASGTHAKIIEQPNGDLLLSIRFTASAGTGVVELLMSDGSETVSYAGSTDATLKVIRATAHECVATLRMDTLGAREATCFALAAHNLGTGGGRVQFQHDSDGDDTWTTIGKVYPTDDSPIMFFFDPVTSDRWRLRISQGVLPFLGVCWLGDPLTFQRSFYSGFTPSRMNRSTEVIGNLSGTGELLGRSVRKTILQEQYSWMDLTYSWVRSNLDGPNGVIQSMEAKPAFLAWRPELTQDVSYIMRSQIGAPASQGVKDLWTFSFNAEVYAYE